MSNVGSYIPLGYYNSAGQLTNPDAANQVAAAAAAKAATLPPSEQALFMLEVENDTDLVSQDGKVPADLDSSLNNLAGAVGQMVDFINKAQNPTALIAAIFSLFYEEEQNAQTTAMTYSMLQYANAVTQSNDDKDAANKLIDGATAQLICSCVSCAVEIAGAMTSIAGSMVSMYALGQAGKPTPTNGVVVPVPGTNGATPGVTGPTGNAAPGTGATNGTTPNTTGGVDDGTGTGGTGGGSGNGGTTPQGITNAQNALAAFDQQQAWAKDMEEIKTFGTIVQAVSTMLQTTGQMVQAAGTYINQIDQAHSKLEEADAQLAAAAAALAGQNQSTATGIFQSLLQFVETMLSLYGQILTAQAALGNAAGAASHGG